VSSARRPEDASIVDAHFALYAFLPLLLGTFRGKPLVVHFQGPWADENVETGDASSWRLRHATCARALRLSARDPRDNAYGRLQAGAVERYGVSPWRVKVVAPGVDLDRFAPGDRVLARERLSLPADAFVVCCARRLVPRMGLSVLLAAWSQLLAADGDNAGTAHPAS
jgi:glycosyltransferase involved in cell wall biosynthesis